MPIFAYFAVIAPVLLGLLCAAESVMGPPGPMPLTTSATGLPAAYVAPKTAPVLTVREGIVVEIANYHARSESHAPGATGVAPVAIPVASPAKSDSKPAAKTKIAKASKKKARQDQQFAQGTWQTSQPAFGGGWDQQTKRPSRAAASRNRQDRNQAGRYAMFGQPFFSPFGTIR